MENTMFLVQKKKQNGTGIQMGGKFQLKQKEGAG